MAVISLSPTSSRILSRATLDLAQDNKLEIGKPDNLYPIALAAYSMDEYRLLAGWPTSLPPFDVHAETAISSEGEILSYRENPSHVEINALARWIADEDDTFDLTALTWTPYQPSYDVVWTTSVDYAPTYVTEYEYRVGQESFLASVINLDSDSQQHFWANINPLIGGGSGYSVVMVVNLHSVYGDTDHPFVGIWCPGGSTPDADTFVEDPGNYMSVTLRGHSLFLGTEQTAPTRVLPISDLLSEPTPFYLAMCFGRPNATIYAGAGVAALRSGTVYTGNEITPLSGNVVLGRSNGTRLNTADMGVLEVAVYSHQLSTEEVGAEVSKLAAIYGGDG